MHPLLHPPFNFYSCLLHAGGTIPRNKLNCKMSPLFTDTCPCKHASSYHKAFILAMIASIQKHLILFISPTLAATYESTCFTLTFLWYNASSVMHKDKNSAGGWETVERTRPSLQKSSKVLRVGISFFYYPCPLNKKDSVTTKSTESNSQKLSFKDSILLHSKNIGNKQQTKLS